MNIEERNKFTKNFFEKCQQILETKGKDYKVNDDANGNFTSIAYTTNLSKFNVWYVFFAKHLSSLNNFIKYHKLESENIESRIMDLINYLVILASMIKEDHANESLHENQPLEDERKCPHGHIFYEECNEHIECSTCEEWINCKIVKEGDLENE